MRKDGRTGKEHNINMQGKLCKHDEDIETDWRYT